MRYKPELGKLGQFIQNDQMLQSMLRTLKFQDHPLHSLVRLKSNSNADAVPTAASNKQLNDDDNETVMTLDGVESQTLASIYGVGEPESPRFSSLNQAALSQLQALLENAHDANPPFSCKSSLLAILMNWADQFKDILGSFESWVRRQTNSNFQLHVVGPGKNYVTYSIPGRQSHQLVPSPAAPAIGPSMGLLGVLPCDFFNIPIGADVGMAENSYRKGCQQFFDMLSSLKMDGVLRNSLNYGSQPFEMLEWYGDAVLHLELSTLLMDSQGAFGGPSVLTNTRQNGEQNLTLALIFDEIGIARLLTRCPLNWSSNNWKVKGDIVEAIIGELADKLRRPDGIPVGHSRRGDAERVIRMFAQCVNLRGQVIKTENQRRQLQEAASAPGGGGFRVTELDVAARTRCSAHANLI